MDKEKLIAASAAIQEHLMFPGKSAMKYDGYDHVPAMARDPKYLPMALNLLSAYASRAEYMNDDGSYDPRDIEVMKYLFRLNRWGEESIAEDQYFTQEHEQGKIINLDVVLPDIAMKVEMAQSAVDFLKPVSALYNGVYIIGKNRYSGHSSEEELKQVRADAERHAIIEAIDFARAHPDPSIINAQIEVLGKLAEISERHYALTKKSAAAGFGNSFMDVGGGFSTGYWIGGEKLPEFFDNYMTYSGLPSSTDELLMEDAPAMKYLGSLRGKIFEVAESDPEGARREAKTLGSELKFIDERGMASHQPKNGSLANAKAAVFAILDKMGLHLGAVEAEIGKQQEQGGFARALDEKRQEGAQLARGGERTEPAARGKWADGA